MCATETHTGVALWGLDIIASPALVLHRHLAGADAAHRRPAQLTVVGPDEGEADRLIGPDPRHHVIAVGGAAAERMLDERLVAISAEGARKTVTAMTELAAVPQGLDQDGVTALDHVEAQAGGANEGRVGLLVRKALALAARMLEGRQEAHLQGDSGL